MEAAWAWRCPHYALYVILSLFLSRCRLATCCLLAQCGMKGFSAAMPSKGRDLNNLRSWLQTWRLMLQCLCLVLQCFFSSVCKHAPSLHCCQAPFSSSRPRSGISAHVIRPSYLCEKVHLKHSVCLLRATQRKVS